MRKSILVFIVTAIIALGIFGISGRFTSTQPPDQQETEIITIEADHEETVKPTKPVEPIEAQEPVPQIKPIQLSVKPTVSYPGDTVFVQASQDGMITFNGKEYKLSSASSGHITFLPISIDQKPSELVIQWIPTEQSEATEEIDEDISKDSRQTKVTIKEKSFSTQYLIVTEEQEKMRRNTKKIEEDQKKFWKALSNPIEEPQFSGAFLQPLEGRFSTMFGYTRYVNGVLSSRHLAIDIAAPDGTPIIAPANGKVVLAESLYLSGNRVIIEHGIELYTYFSNLSRLDVQVGDEVKKGDVIGLVGSTGFSTGPHLHHAVYVHGYAINPELFFGSNPFEWGEEKKSLLKE